MPTHQMEPVAKPGPRLESVDGRIYPLESARVTSRAESGIAATRLTQCYSNPHDEALEVVYTLPLPADGTVLGYTVRIGGKVIKGEVQPREKAEKAYRDALYDGRSAGLLEQDRADSFQQRLGNLPPRTRVEVEVEVLQPLRFLGALDGRAPQWEYRFPTVAGVRYEGSPGRVADADRLDVNRGVAGDIPTRIELDVVIADSPGSGLDVASPSHEIAVDSEGSETRVRLTRGERLDRDVTIHWNACTPDVGVRLVEGAGLEGDTGRYVLITVVPPITMASAFHRDLTVLIDASGSMQGEPLLLAKQVVEDLVRSLEPGDRFELLAFSNDVEKLTQGLMDLSPSSIRRALDSLSKLRADGGTEMLRAVEKAIEPLREDAQRQIVLVTDGYIGFESEVIGHLMNRLPANARVHTVGIGAAPNRTLLHGVALAGRGLELSAGNAETASEAASRLRAGTVRPVLTELEVHGKGVRAHAPGKPRDVFAGQPLLLTAELDSAGGELEVRGRLAGASEPWVWRTVVPDSGAGGLTRSPIPIGALYGRETLSDLELRRAAEPGTAASVDRSIEACGMRHRIVSRRTSLVAIAEEPSVDPKAPRRRERLAVEMPAGVSAEGAGVIGGFPMTLGVFESLDQLSAMPRARSLGTSLTGVFRKHVVTPKSQIEDVTIVATVIKVERELLVVEFETPFDGFELPRDAVEVRETGRPSREATIVVDQSSPFGPYAKGLRVKWALRLEDDETWPRDAVFEVTWISVRVGKEPKPIAVMRLYVDAPLVARESPTS